MGFIFLTFVALVITNVGATAVSGLNFNPNLFFDHQTSESSSFETTQTGNIDFQNINQISKIQSMGIDNIVPIADKSDTVEKHTVPGEIDYNDFPDLCVEELPLCVDDAYLKANWNFTVMVWGGYEPRDGNAIHVVQHKDAANLHVDEWIYISWTEWKTDKTDMCEAVYWNATFTVANDLGYISLASDQLPIITSGAPYNIDVQAEDWPWAAYDYLKDKQVDLTYNNTWAGCHYRDQEFPIILVRENYQFPNI